MFSESPPNIIVGDKFFLGSLSHNRLWYMDDDEVVQLIENLISYALVRDKYRRFVKNRRARRKETKISAKYLVNSKASRVSQ